MKRKSYLYFQLYFLFVLGLYNGPRHEKCAIPVTFPDWSHLLRHESFFMLDLNLSRVLVGFWVCPAALLRFFLMITKLYYNTGQNLQRDTFCYVRLAQNEKIMNKSFASHCVASNPFVRFIFKTCIFTCSLYAVSITGVSGQRII